MHRHLVAALAAAAAACSAPSARAETAWLCALSDDAVRLLCVADADPAAPPEAPATARAVVRGTAFPLDPRRRWEVELWSAPTEPAFVEQLARATICYRSPACSVTLAPWRSGPLASR